MGRGAHFTERFRHYTETGGVAKWKNTVVCHIRINDLRDIDSANGNGTFKVSFFLDTAFWAPWWDAEHFDTQETSGKFSKYEPVWQFPEVDVEGGMLRWGLRSAEFSKNGDARQHESQLGQNYKSLVDKGKAALISAVMGKSSGAGKKTVSVVDKGSHWPRLWRVCISEEEFANHLNLDSKARKKQEPSNEDPMPRALPPRLKELFQKMDSERVKNLPHATEGIGFVTHEVHCTHRNEFSLHEFPFDMYSLKIVMRLDKRDGDPMSRTIVPLAHDKAFFVSSRVSKMVDYHMARNLDWEVAKEPASYGGNQRLTAGAIVRRKPGYFVRNYVVVIFLLTSSTFTAFLAQPHDYNTRVSIIFTVLLSVVAFKNGGSDHMPQVSYATTLDAYILLNFYIVLALATVNFAFSAQCTMGGIMSENPKRVKADISCSRDPGHKYGLHFIPSYDPVVETCVGIFLFGLWLGVNAWYWRKIWRRFQFNLRAIDDAEIGWMLYKYKGPKGTKGKYLSEKLIRFKPSLLNRAVSTAQVMSSDHKSFSAPKAPPAANLLAANPSAVKPSAVKPNASLFSVIAEAMSEEHKAASLIQKIHRRKLAVEERKAHPGSAGASVLRSPSDEKAGAAADLTGNAEAYLAGTVDKPEAGKAAVV